MSVSEKRFERYVKALHNEWIQTIPEREYAQMLKRHQEESMEHESELEEYRRRIYS